ncbi:putative repeat protein (TIGR01451 family) [Actinoplanes octamycinicus]|uniref:Putative repeat protein (TIGR01451 family) n=1 Tax=Actinoplanes octamycinicus TaxID=135948 RepID=A0A7W7M5H2_9ACTN|nr:Ig-like domain-containing protein [Actinoplanes octamycinicus]MBB4737718.1 putative repeat protein (TIGR01451 family) [Actinoplanes octamycinicus]GIE58019.1 hypothetical protein Aoc01nite_34210 [Actinoplanes octamycinicus]
MHRTAAAVLLVWTVVLGCCVFLVDRGVAAAPPAFALRFEANTNGSILLRGNASLVCPDLDPDCRDGRDGTGAQLDDNDFAMVGADADHDLTTLNDSTATVSLPPGSTVLFAGLYWSANVTAGPAGLPALAPASKNRVRLRTPASAAWQPVTASTVYGTGAPYQGFADVTGLVAGAGSGVYGVADIQAGTGQDRYAGWALAIAYRNPAEVLRALRVYDGLGTVSSTSGNLNIPVSGFETPHSGSVRAEVGTVAYEGDLGKRGDALKINGQIMSDPVNPADNYFNSTAPPGGRDPGNANLFGVDVDTVDATDKLGHAATSATLTLTTSSDTYYPGVVTFAIDLYAPKLVTTMTGTDLNGGSLLPGDILEYRIEVRNDGNDTADGTVLTGAIPAYTSFVPGSARLRGAPVPDTVTFTLGDVPYQAVVVAVFQVRVTANAPAGYAITNLVNLSYTGHTAGVGVSGLAGTMASVIAPAQSDLAVTLTGTPAAVQRSALPAPVGYLITVTNNGLGAEPDARAALTLPAGVSAGPLPAGCTEFGQVVTCLLGPLLPGTRGTATIPATVQPAAGARPSASLLGYGANPEPTPADNTATADVVVNLAPRAVADPGQAPGTIAVLGNDDDPDGITAALTVAISTPPLHGSAIVLAGGTVAYTPAAGWAGDDPFTYTITDVWGGSDSAVVTVRTPNAGPVALDDAAAVDTGGTVTVPVTANDSDPNGDPLTVVAVTDPHQGTLSFAGGGITFSPLLTVVGLVTFTYTVSDGQATTTAQLTVDVANAVPTASDDLATVAYAGAVTVPVLGNDQDINGDTLGVVSTGPAGHGTVSISGRDVVYQATDPGFSGTDTFDYTIDDNRNGRATATVTVLVANAPPVVADVVTSTAYRTAKPLPVLAGAADPNGDPLSVIGATDPAHGVVVRNPDGTLTYMPDAGWSGSDSFTFTVGDNRGGTDTGTVTVVVANAPPVARPDAVTLPAGLPATIDVLVNDDDPNGDPLTVSVDVAPLHGVATVSGGRIVFQPAPGWSGADTLHYTITDGRGGTSGATVTIGLVNAPPTARPDTASTPTDTAVPIAVTANDDDPNGDPVTLLSWTTAANGTVAAGPAGSVIYTPAGGFTGADTFNYTITDPAGKPATATVTVVVRNAPPVPVNDTFRVRAQGATTLPVTGNDRDPNIGQTLSVVAAGPAGRGAVTVSGPLTVDYTPLPGTVTDTFDYTLTDDLGGTGTATVTVVVDAAPVAADDAAETGAGGPVVIDALANDTDPAGDPLTVTSAGPAAHGTVTVQADGRIRYLPAAGFAGAEIFRYVIRDPLGNTAQAQVTVLVRAAPAVLPDVAAVRAGQQVSVDVLANDTAAIPGGLTITAVSAPARGTATRSGGTVRYAAPVNWTGQDDFRYAVRDALGGTAEATVTVLVTDVTPLAVADSRFTPYRRAVSIPVLANDLDETGSLEVEAVTRPDHGTATVDRPDAVTYVPPDDFSGVASFVYTAGDAVGHRTSATVTVVVGPPPAVPDKAVTTPPGQPAGIPLPAVDGQGRPVVDRRITQPAHGSARLNSDGSVTYTPDPGFVGEDRFTYEIVDADGNVALGTVVVTVPPPSSPAPSASPSPPAPSPASPSPSPSRSTAPSPSPARPTASVPAAPPPVRPVPPPPGPGPALPTTGMPGPSPRSVTAAAAGLTLLGMALYTAAPRVGRRGSRGGRSGRT